MTRQRTTIPDLQLAVQTYTRMRKEYEPAGDVFDTDTPQVAWFKRRVAELDAADRALFILYTDIGSLEKVARLLGVSKGTIHKEIKRIRKNLLEQYEHLH